MNDVNAKVFRVPVATPGTEYDIVVGAHVLDAAESWLGLPKASHAVVVSNTTVAPLYAERVVAQLRRHYAHVSCLVLPDGERYKDGSTLNLIYDHLLGAACDRKTVLFALGGGVIGDMTGFAAACYMRGVPFVQLPTTLLAQVDSSVGGKTAINHPLGKNMIGAFYQPRRVLCDLSTLMTLPARELNAGLAEVIKYGPIADAEFLDWTEAHLAELQDRDLGSLSYAVKRSCEIKAAIVGQDERESGLRAILNFGHTFGHAIEAGLGFGQWLHGEAVGCGMVMASDLSVRLGLMPRSFAQRMQHIVERAGLPVRGPDLGLDRYMELMQVDKKAESGEIRFVVIDQVGHAAVLTAPAAVVADVLSANTGS